jgi:hypothetical protein
LDHQQKKMIARVGDEVERGHRMSKIKSLDWGAWEQTGINLERVKVPPLALTKQKHLVKQKSITNKGHLMILN